MVSGEVTAELARWRGVAAGGSPPNSRGCRAPDDVPDAGWGQVGPGIRVAANSRSTLAFQDLDMRVECRDHGRPRGTDAAYASVMKAGGKWGARSVLACPPPLTPGRRAARPAGARGDCGLTAAGGRGPVPVPAEQASSA